MKLQDFFFIGFSCTLIKEEHIYSVVKSKIKGFGRSLDEENALLSWIWKAQQRSYNNILLVSNYLDSKNQAELFWKPYLSYKNKTSLDWSLIPPIQGYICAVLNKRHHFLLLGCLSHSQLSYNPVVFDLCSSQAQESQPGFLWLNSLYNLWMSQIIFWYFLIQVANNVIHKI